MEISESKEGTNIFLNGRDLSEMISLNLSKDTRIELSASVFRHTKGGMFNLDFSNGRIYEIEADVNDYMGSPVKLYGPEEFLKELCQTTRHYIRMERV